MNIKSEDEAVTFLEEYNITDKNNLRSFIYNSISYMDDQFYDYAIKFIYENEMQQDLRRGVSSITSTKIGFQKNYA